MEQNYPNPFNPSTVIEFTTDKYGYAAIKVYDMPGREAAVLLNGNITAGRYKITFNASQFPNGMYIYSLESGGAFTVRKMLLIK